MDAIQCSVRRRRKILELLRKEGRVLVRELAHRFRTSQITIRKIWNRCIMMVNWNELTGALSPRENGALKDSSLQEKARRHRPEKRRELQPQQPRKFVRASVILDSGTTTTAMRVLSKHQKSDHHHQRHKYPLSWPTPRWR